MLRNLMVKGLSMRRGRQKPRLHVQLLPKMPGGALLTNIGTYKVPPFQYCYLSCWECGVIHQMALAKQWTVSTTKAPAPPTKGAKWAPHCKGAQRSSHSPAEELESLLSFKQLCSDYRNSTTFPALVTAVTWIWMWEKKNQTFFNFNQSRNTGKPVQWHHLKGDSIHFGEFSSYFMLCSQEVMVNYLIGTQVLGTAVKR